MRLSPRGSSVHQRYLTAIRVTHFSVFIGEYSNNRFGEASCPRGTVALFPGLSRELVRRFLRRMPATFLPPVQRRQGPHRFWQAVLVAESCILISFYAQTTVAKTLPNESSLFYEAPNNCPSRQTFLAALLSCTQKLHLLTRAYAIPPFQITIASVGTGFRGDLTKTSIDFSQAPLVCKLHLRLKR